MPRDTIVPRALAGVRERDERAERIAEHSRRKLSRTMAFEAQRGSHDIIHADVPEPVRWCPSRGGARRQLRDGDAVAPEAIAQQLAVERPRSVDVGCSQLVA